MNAENKHWPGIDAALPEQPESHYTPHFQLDFKQRFNNLVKQVHPLQILMHPIALEGGRSYLEGELLNDNPHLAKATIDDFIHWQNGYLAAKLVFGARMSYYRWESEHGTVLVYANDEREAIDIACKMFDETGHPRKQQLRRHIFAKPPKVVRMKSFAKVL